MNATLYFEFPRRVDASTHNRYIIESDEGLLIELSTKIKKNEIWHVSSQNGSYENEREYLRYIGRINIDSCVGIAGYYIEWMERYEIDFPTQNDKQSPMMYEWCKMINILEERLIELIRRTLDENEIKFI